MIIIISILGILLMGGLVVFLFKKLRELDEQTEGVMPEGQLNSSQDFLPFKDIDNNLIYIGDDKYLAVVECSSINYDLLKEAERLTVERGFNRFLNSLNHRVVFFTQTKEIDHSKMVEKLEKEIEERIKEQPSLENMGRAYLDRMINLNKITGQSKQKKKYILVPFNEAQHMTKLTSVEKRDFSIKEAIRRANVIKDSISQVGIEGKVLNTSELIELVYSIYHRDNYRAFESIVDGAFQKMIVKSKEQVPKIKEKEYLDTILHDTSKRIVEEIDEELLRSDSSFPYAVQEIERVREEIFGSNQK